MQAPRRRNCFRKSMIAIISFFIPIAAHADIVINEVMYRPLNQATNGKYEFIELYNRGTVLSISVATF